MFAVLGGMTVVVPDERQPEHLLQGLDLGYLENLAEAGEVAAQSLLGELLLRGGRYEQARFWMRRAAENGDGEAQLRLALMYESGLGGGRDDAEAQRWYLKAGGNGHVLAQYKADSGYLTAGVP
jgi:hypothetical protein